MLALDLVRVGGVALQDCQPVRVAQQAQGEGHCPVSSKLTHDLGSDLRCANLDEKSGGCVSPALVGLTIRPAIDAGGTPSATPVEPSTQSTESADTSPEFRNTSAARTKVTTNATTSARTDSSAPQPKATDDEDTPNSDTPSSHRQSNDDRARRGEPTTQTSTQVRLTRTPNPTTSSPDDPATTPSTNASSSPSQSTKACQSPSPRDLPRTVKCKVDGLLP